MNRYPNREFKKLTDHIQADILTAEDDILTDNWDEIYPCTGINGFCAQTGEPRPDLTPARFWFNKPDWYFDRLSPVWFGGDEYCRRTLVIGWSATGQLVIPLRKFKDC